jgi:hypothetical protein
MKYTSSLLLPSKFPSCLVRRSASPINETKLHTLLELTLHRETPFWKLYLGAFSPPLAYYNGGGVERDEKEAKHYEELAAIGVHITSRHNLGVYECEESNTRAVKHWMTSRGLDLTIPRRKFVNSAI